VDEQQPWLPEQVQVSLEGHMGTAKEGLLALAVAVGLDVLRSMMEAEVTAVVGPKGKYNGNRKAFRHSTEEGRVVLGGTEGTLPGASGADEGRMRKGMVL
jgi:putative transposase